MSPSWRSAALAIACSSVGLRAVTVVSSSSTGRGERSAIVGGSMRPHVELGGARLDERVEHVGQLGAEHVAPARLHVVRLPELRDAAGAPTYSHARSGLAGTGDGSRSSTVTSWPSLASISAEDRPQKPPPSTITLDIETS